MDLLEQYTKKLDIKKRGDSPLSSLYDHTIRFLYEDSKQLHFVNVCNVQVESRRDYSSFRYEGSGESVVVPSYNTLTIDLTTNVAITDAQFIRTIFYATGSLHNAMLTNMSVEMNDGYSIYNYQFVGN